MTNITGGEMRIVLFSMFFMAILGLFMYIYSQAPITPTTTASAGGVAAVTETGVTSFITGIIGTLPSPFNDSTVLMLFGTFLSVISAFLVPISIRYLKDLATQWV